MTDALGDVGRLLPDGSWALDRTGNKNPSLSAKPSCLSKTRPDNKPTKTTLISLSKAGERDHTCLHLTRVASSPRGVACGVVMARRGQHWLTALDVKSANKPGRYGDGAGLYLQVEAAQSADGKEGLPPVKSWTFLFTAPDGRRREMGLGPFPKLSLTDARKAAEKARNLLVGGVDPIDARKAEKTEAKLVAARAITFKQAAQAYIDANKRAWKNAKHAAQWTATLEAYAFKEIGSLPVGTIDTGLVLKVIEPIWAEKPETASRLRGRIEAVLTWATVRGYRVGENPARWRGHLSEVLPERGKVRKVKHHTALPYGDAGAFMRDLRKQDGVAALALEFAILTAARTGEVLGATWAEIDLDAAVWTVPDSRMKAGKQHRVALSKQAVAVLRRVQGLGGKKWVFPGPNPKKPLSSMSMLMLLRRMKREGLTVHGFRSCFRDWAGDSTTFAREVVEAALAHSLGNKVEAAYRRSDALAKRARLMCAWADYLDKPAAAGEVVSIGKRKREEC